MSFRPLSVGFPGGGCAAPRWFVRWFGGCCSLLCHAGCLVVWCAPFSAALALGCVFSGGWLVLCSGPAFSGCAPLELGFSCASLGKKCLNVSHTPYRASKSVFYPYVQDLRPAIAANWRGLRGLVHRVAQSLRGREKTPPRLQSSLEPSPSVQKTCGRNERKHRYDRS